MKVPDGMTPITGFRSWGMGLGRLWSTRGPAKVRWPLSKPLRARCLRHGAPGFFNPRSDEHDAPAPECTCGIYGAVDPWDVDLTQQRYPFTLVVGRVEAWGRIAVGARGFRAEVARPIELIAQPWWDDRTGGAAQKVADAYGIPVVSPEAVPA